MEKPFDLLPWAPPAEEGKSAMMNNMKRGQVSELLPGNKEHRVGQVNKLKHKQNKVLSSTIMCEIVFV